MLSNNRCLIVAEVAQAHDGSLGIAHSFIDAAANAGADIVKFQTHIADAETTPAEPWRVKFSYQDSTRYDYWKRMEFTEEQWHGLKKHADDRGLGFLSSPFSLEAVELLSRVGIVAWKVASGEVSNLPMLDRMLDTQLPIWLSSGMSHFSELDAAVAQVKAKHNPLTVMQCTTAYPCPPEKIGLNLLGVLRDRYGCDIGLSDHSGTIYPGLAAVTLGITILEVHVTFSREMFGPDALASLTLAELQQLVTGVRFIEQMQAHPVDKEAIADSLSDLHDIFTKSLVVIMDLPAGTLLKREHLAIKKPGTGIPARELDTVIGRRLQCAVVANTPLTEADIEGGL